MFAHEGGDKANKIPEMFHASHFHESKYLSEIKKVLLEFDVALNNLHNRSCHALDRMSFNPRKYPPLMVPIFQMPFKVQHVALTFG